MDPRLLWMIRESWKCQSGQNHAACNWLLEERVREDSVSLSTNQIILSHKMKLHLWCFDAIA